MKGLEGILLDMTLVVKGVNEKLLLVGYDTERGLGVGNKNFLEIQWDNFNECIDLIIPDLKQVRKTYEDDLDEVKYIEGLKRIITYGLDVMDDIDCKIDLHLNEYE